MHQETNHQASKGHQGRYYCTTVLPYFCEVTTIPMPKPCNHRHRSSEGPSCFELDESFPTRRHSQQSAKCCVSEPDPQDPIALMTLGHFFWNFTPRHFRVFIFSA